MKSNFKTIYLIKIMRPLWNALILLVEEKLDCLFNLFSGANS